tara:strand:+ start:297 stop:839 length:543 start_codon:yes stop_codon:yes gene_type:complete
MSEEREGKIYMWFVVIFFIGVAFALIELVNRSYISVRQISTRELESVARLYLSDGSKVFSQHGGKKNWTEISLRKLSEQFRYNSVVAEDRWMGRRILSRATISSVDDGFNDATVTVLLTDTLNIASCNHDRSEHYYRQFGAGDNIWFIGVLVSEETGLRFAKCEYFNISEKPLPPNWRPK